MGPNFFSSQKNYIIRGVDWSPELYFQAVFRISIGFNADPDTDLALKVNAEPDPGFDDKKSKNSQLKKFFVQNLQLTMLNT